MQLLTKYKQLRNTYVIMNEMQIRNNRVVIKKMKYILLKIVSFQKNKKIKIFVLFTFNVFHRKYNGKNENIDKRHYFTAISFFFITN